MRAPGLGNGGGSMAPGLLAASLDRWRDCPPGRGRWENRLGQGKTGLGSEFCREIRRQVMRRWPEERGGLPPLKTHSGASTVVGQVKLRSSGVERRALAARAAIPPLGRGSRAWGPPGGHQGGQGRKGSPPALRRGGVTQDVPLPVVGEQGFPLVQVNVGPPGPQPDGWDSGAPSGPPCVCCHGLGNMPHPVLSRWLYYFRIRCTWLPTCQAGTRKANTPDVTCIQKAEIRELSV